MIGNHVYRKVSRVRIPPSPPVVSYKGDFALTASQGIVRTAFSVSR